MIIGLSGKRGVGKTTAAEYLVRNHGFKRISFAGYLRDIAKTFFEFSDSDLIDPVKKESNWRMYDWTPRDFLIDLGLFVRKYDADFWVNKALSDLYDSGLYVIDDVRFENEYDRIISKGGHVWRIIRRSPYNIYTVSIDSPSENSLDAKSPEDYHAYIINEGTLNELYASVEKGLIRLTSNTH